MAKVYDALRRLEEERKQHGAASPELRLPNQPVAPPSSWARWWRRVLGADQRMPPGDAVLQQRLETLAARVAVCEDSATHAAPTIERLLQSLQTHLVEFDASVSNRLAAADETLQRQLIGFEAELTARLARADQAAHDSGEAAAARITARHTAVQESLTEYARAAESQLSQHLTRAAAELAHSAAALEQQLTLRIAALEQRLNARAVRLSGATLLILSLIGVATVVTLLLF